MFQNSNDFLISNEIYYLCLDKRSNIITRILFSPFRTGALSNLTDTFKQQKQSPTSWRIRKGHDGSNDTAQSKTPIKLEGIYAKWEIHNRHLSHLPNSKQGQVCTNIQYFPTPFENYHPIFYTLHEYHTLTRSRINLLALHMIATFSKVLLLQYANYLDFMVYPAPCLSHSTGTLQIVNTMTITNNY